MRSKITFCLLSPLRTPAEASALQYLVAETGPVDQWLCPMWCREDQLRAGYSECQGSWVPAGVGVGGTHQEEGTVWAQTRRLESAWRLPALSVQGLGLAEGQTVTSPHSPQGTGPLMDSGGHSGPRMLPEQISWKPLFGWRERDPVS